jgi:serine/threonine protein kinase
MVGAFGEVQVMDWGLAKTLTKWPQPPEEELDGSDPWATRRPEPDFLTPSGNDQTQDGAVLGTPAFMPPEQARGLTGKIDARSDVFGLGATLCVLLTGEPPFAGPNSRAARELAVEGKLDGAFARLDGCGAPAELVALCKRCLAVEQDERPRDGAELAETLAALRRRTAERARQAELEKGQAEVRAAEHRKQRKLTLIAAGVVIAALSAGILGTTVGLFREARQRGEADEARVLADGQRVVAEAARALAETKRKEAEQERVRAEKARDLARHRFRLALGAYQEMVFDVQNELKDRPGTSGLLKRLLADARRGLQELSKEAEGEASADSTLVWTYFQRGDVELRLGDVEAARAEYQAGHRLAKRLADADRGSLQALRDLSVSHNKLGDVALDLHQ